MLLRAIATDVGHITAGKVYESAGVLDIGQFGYEIMVIIFNDSREWAAIDMSFFEPAVERS